MRFYLAGCESKDRFASLSQGVVTNAFCSYFYADKAVPSVGVAQAHKHTKSVIIDSGAHTFFNADPNKLNSAAPNRGMKAAPEPHKYFGEYLDWLDGNRAYYDYFVELDIGSIVTQKVVLKWRGEIAKRGLLDKCIIVYHPTVETWKTFLAAAKAIPSRYVALEGIAKDEIKFDYNAVIRPLYEAGIKVHGFAMIKPKYLRLIPFYSVDSASWMAGAMFGLVQQTTAKGMFKTYLSKPTTERQRLQLGKILASDGGMEMLASTSKDQRVAREIFAAREFSKLEAQFTAYWKRRGIDWDAQVQNQKTPNPNPAVKPTGGRRSAVKARQTQSP